MNDEGIGIAGWLLADLTLVLALIFLALVPGRPAAQEPSVEPPVITDIGCRPADPDAAMPVVTCKPIVEGEVRAYEWKVSERGTLESAPDAETLTAEFDGAGWVRLAVSNEGGETYELYDVIPPTPTPEPTPESGLLQADFRFDQLVLSGIGSGPVSGDEIAGARVREKLRKEQEDTKDIDIDDFAVRAARSDQEQEYLTAEELLQRLTAKELLQRRQNEGYRIALIETFSHSTGGDGTHIQLSKDVNEAFFEYLRGRNSPPDRCIFLNDDVSDDWTANYRDRTNLARGSSRINLYFVLEPEAACDSSP